MRIVSVLILGVATLLVATTGAFAGGWPDILIYQKDGSAANDYFGSFVAGAGDVNGDGIGDFIIGAYFADPGGLSNAGSAFVFDGATGSLLYQKDGDAAGDRFGRCVAGAGDVNGDGFDDFIVGAHYADPGMVDAGTAYVFDGATGNLLYQKDGGAAGDHFGHAVAGAGDVNDDDTADFIIGAWATDPGGQTSAGSAYVYDGATGDLLYQKNGGAGDDRLGNCVAGAGDVNGDGFDDVIVGAWQANPGGRTDAGSAFVYDGATGDLLYRKDGSASYDNLGCSVAGAGDVNGDDIADFIIGAHNANPGGMSDAGSAYVYDGATGNLLYQKDGNAADDRFGHSVAGMGDVNGDGMDDFVIGAYSADPGGRDRAGSVYLYDGATGSLLTQIDGGNAEDGFGTCVAGTGDVNGDGIDDFIIGAQGVMSFAGAAYIMDLRTLHLTSIADVPNDQGKQLRMRWRSIPGIGDSLMDGFIVYRRIDDGLSAGAKQLVYDPGELPPGDWEQVAVLMATGDSAYTTVVPTLVDSTLTEGAQYSVFLVRGRSTNPLLYIDSPIDSAYSEDNLAPAPPPMLVAEASGPDAALDWGAVADADFDYYWVYRDMVPGFALDPSKQIGATSDTSFLDGSVPGSPVYYRVTAVDFAGNEGDPSNEASVQFCDCPFQCDYDEDTFLTSLDLGALIDVLFAGRAEDQDPQCPSSRGDFDCDGFPTALDLGGLIDHLFAGGDAPCDPCAP